MIDTNSKVQFTKYGVLRDWSFKEAKMKKRKKVLGQKGKEKE